MKKIVIVAGDESGDVYGALLCKKLKEKYSSIEIYSFAGAHLAQCSHQVINVLDHAVTGFIEVIASLKDILNTLKKTEDEIHKLNPDLIILIDFPGFNLRLAKKLNKKYPLFYYVSPQVWAWNKKRIKTIKKYVDKMIVIFQFEEKFYKTEGVDALYFGHPLLEIIPQKELEAKNIISFLPGSRKNEVKKHLPVMQKAKTILEKNLPGYSFQVIRPRNLEENFYNSFYPNMKIIPHSYDAIQESKFIITSSGTATIELALLKVPFIIIYKLNTLSWQIGKRIIKTDFIGMVNILSKEKIVDELLQNEFTPKIIAGKTLLYLKNPDRYQKMKNDLAKIREILSPYGATEKIAGFIGKYLNL